MRRLLLHWACAWLVIIGPIPLAGRAAVAGAAGELTPAASAPWAMAPPVDAAMAEEVLSTEPPLYRRDATVSTGDQIASPTSAEPQQSALRSAGGFVTQAASLTGGGSRFVPLEQPLRLLDTRYWSLGPAIRLPGAQLGASELAPLVDGRRLTVRVAGANGMPSGVAGVVLNVTITAPQSAGYLTVWPAGQVPPLASNLNFGPGQTVSGLVVSPTSSDEVDVMSTASEAHVIVDLFGYFLPGEDGGLVDSDPFRIADTRETAPLGPGESRTLLYARRASTRAVLLNVTVTEPTEQTFVAATPSGRDWSGTSNLNVERGQTVANLVVAPIGPDGGVAFVNGAGSAHVVVDVMGVFDDELAGMRGPFHGLSPGRILDTRDGNPDGRVGPLGAGDVLSLTVAGRGNVPVGSTHALVTLTSTGASEPTYLTAWASGAPRPFISNLNPKPASDIPNMALVPIGADGRVNIYNAAGSVHVVVDIVGYVDPLVGVGAPVAVNASSTTGGGVDVRWLPAISPRGANPTGYIVQVSGNGPSLGGVVVAGNVRNAHVDFVAAPGEQLVAWVLPTFVVDGVARTGPRTGARFTMGNRLWAPRLLRVSQPGRVPELTWEPLGGVTGYEVAVRGTAGGWQSRWLPAESPTQTVPPQVLSPVIGLTGLDAAAVYRVAVRAVAPSGPGPWSESILVGTDQPRLREVGLSEVGPVTGNFHVAHPFTGDIRVINPISGTTLSGFTSVTMPTTVGITPDEQRLVVSSGVEQLIAILDAATGVVQRRVPLPTPGQPRVSVIDNRYAIVSVWYDNWRLDLTSGALTPVTFTRSDGGLLDTNQFPLRGSRDPNVALLGTERIRFVDGIPQGLGQAPVSSLDVRAAANGRAWLTTACTVLDSAFQPVRTVPGCRPGAISAEGSVVYRWDSVNSHFEAIDVASGAVIARAGDSESGWETAVSAGVLLVQRGYTAQLVDLRSLPSTPPAGSPPASVQPLVTGVGPVADHRLVTVHVRGMVVSVGVISPVAGAVGYRAELIPLGHGPTLTGRSTDPWSITMREPTEPMGYTAVMWAEMPNGTSAWLGQRQLEVGSLHRVVLAGANWNPLRLGLTAYAGLSWAGTPMRVTATPVGGGPVVTVEVPTATRYPLDMSSFELAVTGLSPQTAYDIVVQPVSPQGDQARSAPYRLTTGPA